MVLLKLNHNYTQHLANVINDFIRENKLPKLDAICSHGHVILHQPHNGFTLQIGNLPQIATLTKHTVVCDFRVQDVKLVIRRSIGPNR
jgi:anhydro-N-acetylmuramic acid kinase